MNHLAHLLLSGPDPDHRLGALLGDHVKGIEALSELRPGLRKGVMLHRRIDTWSDRHPAVTGLLAQMQPPWRRYGGIVLDVLFDHMLDRHWSRFAEMELEEFALETDRLMVRHRSEMPGRMADFTRWAEAVGLWQRYGEREMLDEIFHRIARRHGRMEPLARGTEMLDRLEPEIERAFLELFPELLKRSAHFRSGEPG